MQHTFSRQLGHQLVRERATTRYGHPRSTTTANDAAARGRERYAQHPELGMEFP